MNAVELDQISKRFGALQAVAQLSLHVPEGTIYGFIGPNGSGKTTTLRILLNIIQPDGGVVRLFGQPTSGVRDSKVGYLPEERGVYRRMTVRELLYFFAKLKTGRALEREVAGWLERFNLKEWADKRLETLSKGMAQKVQFIVAVLGEPRLLVLDEPFSGLDPVNMDVLRQAVLDLRARGATVLFSTHDMSMAERMCDFICMIYKGRKVLDGTLSSIQDQYGADTVRVRWDGGAARFDGIAGIHQVADFGQLQELRLQEGADAQQVLAELMNRGRIHSYEVARPALHDIFVRIAGPEAKEATDA
jgi:ABC-2 type transport system ATP-binding protein